MALSVYTKECSKNIAGNSALLVTEASNISEVTSSGGEVTGITMVGSATFKELQADQDSIFRSEEATGNASNIAYTHAVGAGFAKGTVNLNTLRDSLAAASPCGIVAIVLDSNGTAWLVGWNETDDLKRALHLQQDNYASGNSPVDEDAQKADIVLQCVSGYESLPLNATLTTSVTTALASGSGAAIEWSPESYGPELHTGPNAASDPNGNEANATTGWSIWAGLNLGANIFQSQSTIQYAGTYAIEADSNDTPTSGSGFSQDFNVEAGASYRITFAWRHKGIGGAWGVNVEGTLLGTLASSQTTFIQQDYTITAGDTTMRVIFQEQNTPSTGGIYLDNFSIRKVL